MTFTATTNRMKRKFMLIFSSLLLSVAAFGQGLTTSALNGLVSSNTGEELIGATVIATHTPSGTVYGTTTRIDGHYNLNNLRPGGPYTIRVTYIGYRTEEKSGINLQLSQNLKLNFMMSIQDIMTDEILVTGEKNSIISSARTGASTNVSEKQLKALPSVSRSIQDFTKLTPQISGGNVAGRNSKYNNIQVDGAVLNDVFGLPANGTPGGQAGTQPISLDAIQEFQVAISPYDIRQGGFTGGTVNAITRSGSNKFEGSLFEYFRNESFVGNGPDDEKYPEFNEHQMGFRLGGPIFQDKLFFFVNGEYTTRSQPNIQSLIGPGQDSLVNVVLNTAKTKYNYNPGSYSNFTDETVSGKLFLRLDYNFDENNRLILRHNFVKANDDNMVRNAKDFYFENSNYIFNSLQNSTVLQLNSTIGNNMTNEFRVAFTTIRDDREIEGSPFPMVKIKTTQAIWLGSEQFSVANKLDQDIFEVTNDFNYFLNNHVITLGTHNEFFSFDNLFIRNLYGYYEFNNVSDFVSGSPSAYDYSYSNVAGNKKPSAKFDAAQFSFYLQDEWTFLPNLKLTGGIRIDIPHLPDSPTYNKNIDTTTAFHAKGYNTSNIPENPILWSPRVGFNYDVFDDKTLQVRGGSGIFTGRVPFVWVSNAFSNSGIEFGRVSGSLTNTAPLPPLDIDFNPDPNSQPLTGTGLQASKTTEVNLLDKDFKYTQLFRNNIAIDNQLPFGLIGTLELIHSISLNDVWFDDVNRVQSGVTFDGRPKYGTKVNGTNFTEVVLMKNTSKGYQYSVTGQVQKLTGNGDDLIDNLSGSLSYTYGHAEDVNSGTSSQARSQIRYTKVFDPKAEKLSISDYNLPHRVLAVASYDFDLVSDFTTTISFIYEGRSGYAYSYAFSGDYNSDVFSDNDILYVPKNLDENIVLTDNSRNGVALTGDALATAWSQLNSFISKDDLLKENRGKVLDRNNGQLPWVNQLDFRLVQKIPVPITDGINHSVEFSLDIQNVLNLLNKEWGVEKILTNDKPLVFKGWDGNKAKVYFDGATLTDPFKNNPNSRWFIQFGARYNF